MEFCEKITPNRTSSRVQFGFFAPKNGIVPSILTPAIKTVYNIYGSQRLQGSYPCEMMSLRSPVYSFLLCSAIKSTLGQSG